MSLCALDLHQTVRIDYPPDVSCIFETSVFLHSFFVSVQDVAQLDDHHFLWAGNIREGVGGRFHEANGEGTSKKQQEIHRTGTHVRTTDDNYARILTAVYWDAGIISGAG